MSGDDGNASTTSETQVKASETIPPSCTVEIDYALNEDATDRKEVDEDFTSILGGGAMLPQNLESSRRPSSIYSGRTERAARRRFLLTPYSTLRKIADLTLCVLLLYCAIMIPFQVAFDEMISENETAWTIIFTCDLLVDFFFLLDVLLNFRTTYYRQGEVIDDPKLIAKHYLSGWFTLDFVTSLPVGLLVEIIDPADSSLAFLRFPKLLRFMKLAKLIRLLKMARVGVIIERHLSIPLGLLRFLRFTFFILVLAHIVGCMFYLIGDSSLNDGSSSSWIRDYGIEYSDMGTKYVASIYWAFTTLTTVGYGDIIPQTDSERVYALFAMVMGASIFGYIVGNLASLFTSSNKQIQQRKEQMKEVISFMKEKHLPKDLQERIWQYFDYVHKAQGDFDEHKILCRLSPTLRREVALYLFKDLIRRVPFFRTCDMDFVTAIVTRLMPLKFEDGDTICREGEIGKHIFIVKSGSVSLMKNLRECGIPHDITVTSLYSGSIFGEVEVLLDVKRYYSVLATTTVELFVIPRDALLLALDDFPDIHDQFIQAAVDRSEQHLTQLKVYIRRILSPFGSKAALGTSELDMRPEDADAVTPLLGAGAGGDKQFVSEALNKIQEGDEAGDNETPTTILVLEDDFCLQVTLSALLENEGFTVHMANDRREGVQMFQQDSTMYHEVIADAYHPEFEGFVREIRQSEEDTPYHTPLLALVLNDVQANLNGCDATCQKPIHHKEFLRTVKYYLDAAHSGLNPMPKNARLKERWRSKWKDAITLVSNATKSVRVSDALILAAQQKLEQSERRYLAALKSPRDKDRSAEGSMSGVSPTSEAMRNHTPPPPFQLGTAASAAAEKFSGAVPAGRVSGRISPKDPSRPHGYLQNLPGLVAEGTQDNVAHSPAAIAAEATMDGHWRPHQVSGPGGGPVSHSLASSRRQSLMYGGLDGALTQGPTVENMLQTMGLTQRIQLVESKVDRVLRLLEEVLVNTQKRPGTRSATSVRRMRRGGSYYSAYPSAAESRASSRSLGNN
eukprot:Rmarinus@m.25663